QSFYSASNTNFLNGNPVLVRIFPVDDPVARLVGASDLKPEKSRNLSLGAVLDVHRLTLSADYYNIKVRDRIAISSNFQDARITSLLA
ncbi:TonB-dependent receptor, partial [Escherichia coli]